jgi:hypothetical protein
VRTCPLKLALLGAALPSCVIGERDPSAGDQPDGHGAGLAKSILLGRTRLRRASLRSRLRFASEARASFNKDLPIVEAVAPSGQV